MHPSLVCCCGSTVGLYWCELTPPAVSRNMLAFNLDLFDVIKCCHVQLSKLVEMHSGRSGGGWTDCSIGFEEGEAQPSAQGHGSGG